MRFLSIICCMAAFSVGRAVAQGTSREPGRHAQTAHWMPRTTDWTKEPSPIIGDWGFDRPGYAPGLYIHGVTVKAGEKVTNPVLGLPCGLRRGTGCKTGARSGAAGQESVGSTPFRTPPSSSQCEVHPEMRRPEVPG